MTLSYGSSKLITRIHFRRLSLAFDPTIKPNYRNTSSIRCRFKSNPPSCFPSPPLSCTPLSIRTAVEKQKIKTKKKRETKQSRLSSPPMSRVLRRRHKPKRAQIQAKSEREGKRETHTHTHRHRERERETERENNKAK